MTLCTDNCPKKLSCVAFCLDDRNKVQDLYDLDQIAGVYQRAEEESPPEKMAPKEEKSVRCSGDVYETDSERSQMHSARKNSKGRNTDDANKTLLFNVLESKGYMLGKVLGKGSFAVVHDARKKSSDAECAIKVVDCSKAPEDFITHFFPRELKIIRELQHENVISVTDIVKVNWYTCIVMERADQGDILDYLVEKGPMEDEVAKSVFTKICLALEYCHSKHIAHRDLKCENVLLTMDNNVKLADFGFARYVVNKDNMRVLSQTYCGSAAYAAPEVLLGKPYNPLMSDLWSVGIILYVMINAVMPFDDTSHKRMVDAQRTRKWAFHPERRSHISPNCRRVVRGLLEPDVTRRTPLRVVLTSPWLSVPSSSNFLADLAVVAKAGKTIS